MPTKTNQAATDAAVAAAMQSQQAVAQAQLDPVRQLKATNLGKLNAIVATDNYKDQFRKALGRHADSFVASLIELCNTDSKLLECKPAQVVAEALKAATLRLPINKQLGFAFIIPFKNRHRDKSGNWVDVIEPVFQIGYKGYVQLAMHSGQYKCINSDLVYEGEFVSKDKLSGAIDLSGKKISDKVVGYFAHEELNNGFTKTIYMTVEEVARHAKTFSKGVSFETSVEDLIAAAAKPFDSNSKAVGWLGNFHAMAMKTLVRNLLSKYGYLSIEMNNAMANDIDNDSSLTAENNPDNQDFDSYEEVTDTTANA